MKLSASERKHWGNSAQEVVKLKMSNNATDQQLIQILNAAGPNDIDGVINILEAISAPTPNSWQALFEARH